MTDEEIRKALLDTTAELDELRREFKITTDPQEERQLLLKMQEILLIHRHYFQAPGV